MGFFDDLYAANKEKLQKLIGDEFKIPDMGNHEEVAEAAATAVPADIIMFSGCKDDQSSADAHSSQFGLQGGKGGACTNAMMLALDRDPSQTWVELLTNMRENLKTCGRGMFAQIPQLCSSRPIKMDDKFAVMNPNSNGNTKALYIGINYALHPEMNAQGVGALGGCHNDVLKVKQYAESQGFSPNNCKILMDDGSHNLPTYQNIMEGFHWLAQGAQAGDSLLLMYAGHGTSMADDDGDEADGKDEALVPCDSKTAYFMRDDDIYANVVAPIPDGVTFTIIMDCCHSGTILDLPYNFEASDANLSQAAAGGYQAPPKQNYNWSKPQKAAQSMQQMMQQGGPPQFQGHMPQGGGMKPTGFPPGMMGGMPGMGGGMQGMQGGMQGMGGGMQGMQGGMPGMGGGMQGMQGGMQGMGGGMQGMQGGMPGMGGGMQGMQGMQGGMPGMGGGMQGMQGGMQGMGGGMQGMQGGMPGMGGGMQGMQGGMQGMGGGMQGMQGGMPGMGGGMPGGMGGGMPGGMGGGMPGGMGGMPGGMGGGMPGGMPGGGMEGMGGMPPGGMPPPFNTWE